MRTPMYSRQCSFLMSGSRLNILPFKSHDTMTDAKRSFRNSIVLMRLNVSGAMIYDWLAAGWMSNG